LLQANVANAKQLDDINAQIATLEKQLDAQHNSIETAKRKFDSGRRGIIFKLHKLKSN
jgi:flagellar biosynthesis chaperone FliJ